MPRFAANLTMLFDDRSFLDRFAAAADCGFEAVEFLFPYEYPAELIADRLKGAGLEQVLFNLPPGDWAAGERGMAAIPGREEEFRKSVEIALTYARALECKNLHAMSGIVRGLDPSACEETFIANIRYAADALAREERTLLIEPINSRDMPGYFVSCPSQAMALLDRIDRSNVSIQLDLYHAQIMGGDLTRLIEMMAGRFAHVQIASVPDRHEPDHGEVCYPHIFDVLDLTDYGGWVGCEYRPRGDTVHGLGWFQNYRRRA